MTYFSGPYGPIELPDESPSVKAPGDFGELAHLMDWAASLQAAFEAMQNPPNPPCLRFVSYGALSPDIDKIGGLGVILFCDYVEGQGSGQVGELQVNGANFPIVQRIIRSDIRTGPLLSPGMNGATATCWARSSKTFSNGAAVGEGFLTAKHILPTPVHGGMTIPLRGGSTARLIDMAPDCFDAALLSHTINTHASLGASWTVAVNQLVVVDGSVSGSYPAKVSSVVDPLGLWSRPARHKVISLRFTITPPGQSGDSGALVQSDIGTGLGIYLGSYQYDDMNPSLWEGYCQNLEQIRHIMGLTLFHF